MKKSNMLLLLGALTISNLALADLNTGLVAYYCFNDTTNLSKDCSTNGNNGSTIGAVTAVIGWKGTAAKFGGYKNPSSIRVPNSNSLKFSQDFSVSYAAKLSGLDGMDGWGSYQNTTGHGTAHEIIFKDNSSNGLGLLLMPNLTDNSIYLHETSFGWNSGTDPLIGKIPNYKANQWIHVVYIYSNSTHTAKAFINGVLFKQTTNFTANFSNMNSSDLYLGKAGDFWFPFNGALDEIRLYNRAISSDEVKSLYADTNIVKGVVTWAKPAYSVQCINNTTSKSVVIAQNTIANYDCEQAGLVIKSGDDVSVTIKGKKY
jgi:hypothetical protein